MKLMPLGALILFLCKVVSLSAQPLRLSVSGKVTDSLTNRGLPFATVILTGDEKTRQNGQTDKDGNYTFNNLTPGTYRIQVRYIGYKDLEAGPYILEQLSLQLVPIQMALAQYDLNGVQVKAARPLIEQSLDKLTINVAESPLSASNTLGEILQRSPGVKLNEDGSLLLNGKKVMVNAKWWGDNYTAVQKRYAEWMIS